jgi:hypothetical protein
MELAGNNLEVLNLLALLVQKYKYCGDGVVGIELAGNNLEVLNLLALLVQKYKY